MQRLRKIAKPISHLLAFGLLAVSIQMPVAHATMVGTETVVNATQIQHHRTQLQQLLERDEVQAQLEARGVDTAQVQARVDSLTDQEVQALAGKLDQLPAGGDSLVGALLFVFIVLLITDILGLTNVFPFVKHSKR